MSAKKKKRVRGKYPIIFLSGRHGGNPNLEKVWLKRTGCKHRCFSFAYVCPGAFFYRKDIHGGYEESLRQGCQIMMDSSAHSFHNFVTKSGGKISRSKRHKPTDVEALRHSTVDLYIQYCQKNAHLWDFYVNFDYVRHAPTVYAMQQIIEAGNLRPVPVFHGDDGMDWLHRYVDEGHTLIGVGHAPMYHNTWKAKRQYLDRVFNEAEKLGVLLHGFAMTSLSIMYAYPWYSVDSATWVKVAAFGHIIDVDPLRHTIGQLHVSDRSSKENLRSYNRMQPGGKKAIREKVESHGFDFDLVRSSLVERCTYNGWLFSHMHELGVTVQDHKLKLRTIL